jgi:predicted RNA-binding Zn-ribbon protein involved in translation (DUF1610 family)
MKLDVKKAKGPSKARRITVCPECGSTSIEWKLALEVVRHAYVCRDCNYVGTMVLKTEVD